MRNLHDAALLGIVALFAVACSDGQTPGTLAPDDPQAGDGGGGGAAPPQHDASDRPEASGADATGVDGDASSATSDGGAAPDGPPEACSAGLGERWTCDGSGRVRCVDGLSHREPCENGCIDGAAGEAICSCGAHAGYTRWNCTPNGDRASCAGGNAWAVDSCGGAGCTAGPDGRSDVCNHAGDLQQAIAALGASCRYGLRCAIAVRDLVTNARAGLSDDALFVSASSAKAIWVGAALHDRSIADVEPHVGPIFKDSDNLESGAVIDLLSSPERVNTFQWQDGELADTGFCHWNYGKDRLARNCPYVLGDDNFFSAGDAVSYLAQIWDHSLLGSAKSDALLSWMQLSPREGYGGWLGTQLPSTARASMHHKAGWRPPGSVDGYANANANEIGIVELPSGHAYAVAILIDGDVSSDTYDRKALPLLEYLSCAVYHAVAGDGASSCSPP